MAFLTLSYIISFHIFQDNLVVKKVYFKTKKENIAGGFTEEADISKINLAYVVQDGQKIIIPNKNNSEEIESGDYISEDAGNGIIEESKSVGGKVNINTATQTELESVSGIGPSLASKIIQYRTLNGKFISVEDLKKVSGIGKSKYESIKDEVIVK